MRWLTALEYWLAQYRKIWLSSAISGFLAPLLYLASLGYGLGTLVDGHSSGRPDGVAYVAFVAPGILAANAMYTAFGESTYGVLGAVKWQRQYPAQLASPLTTTDVLTGHLAFIAVRIALAATSFLVIGGLLRVFDSAWVVLALPVAVLTGVAHATPVMAFAVRQENDQGFTMLFRFGVVPMFLFAGTFFPVDQLPAGLRVLAWLTPLWHGTMLCRELSLGSAHLLPSLGHLAYLLVWALGGAALAIRCYRSKLAT
jgi:lipooligosaccharide transport system permease protein